MCIRDSPNGPSESNINSVDASRESLRNTEIASDNISSRPHPNGPSESNIDSVDAVSYTHLDVYKRQRESLVMHAARCNVVS